MPRKAVNKAATKTKPVAKPKKVVRKKAADVYQLPPPMPKGEVLTDLLKKKWVIGESIGVGGFGEIYSAHNLTDGKPTKENFVIKIEPHSNGPLFCEMHFYQKAAKAEDIDEWVSKHKLSFLGMPKFVATGFHEYKGDKYRFMVMERFGTDIQKKLTLNNNKLPLKTIYTIALQILDVLEYIHSKTYVHADVKASNLLTGFEKEKENNVYLVDFGLACKYMINGDHKEYKADPKKAHDGTIEFTSRDAHIGVLSRRSDLETLAYNMLQWSCGRLPWEDNLDDCNAVMNSKNKYMDNIPQLMKECYKKEKVPDGMQSFLTYIVKLSFTDSPDYEKLRNLLKLSLKKGGFKNNGILEFGEKLQGGKRSKSTLADESISDDVCASISPKKRKPCRTKNSSPDMHFVNADTSSSFDEESLIGSTTPTPAMIAILKVKKQKHKNDKKLAVKKRKPIKPKLAGITKAKTKSSPENRKIVRRKSPRSKIFSNSLSPEV